MRIFSGTSGGEGREFGKQGSIQTGSNEGFQRKRGQKSTKKKKKANEGADELYKP